MKPRKSRDVALMLVGIVCLAAYILACRPAFSPDGSKVLSYWPGVIVYDRTSQAADLVFLYSKGGTTESVIAQWTADGKGVVIIWREPIAEDENKATSLRVLVLPLGARYLTRLYATKNEPQLDKKAWEAMLYFSPPPIVGEHLFLAGESIVLRIDLETGRSYYDYRWKGLPFLWSDGQEVYYLSGPPEGGEDCEIGRIDKDTLDRLAVIRFLGPGSCEVNYFIAMSKDIARYAVTNEPNVGAVHGGQKAIFIFNGNDLERRIPVESESNPISLGNMQWSPDGATIYAAFAKRIAQDKAVHLGVLEVAVDGSSMREIPVLRAQDEDARSLLSVLLGFQIALSPDGRTIAATTIAIGKIKKEDHGLYLVDLASPDRKMTRIPFPEEK